MFWGDFSVLMYQRIRCSLYITCEYKGKLTNRSSSFRLWKGEKKKSRGDEEDFCERGDLRSSFKRSYGKKKKSRYKAESWGISQVSRSTEWLLWPVAHVSRKGTGEGTAEKRVCSVRITWGFLWHVFRARLHEIWWLIKKWPLAK